MSQETGKLNKYVLANAQTYITIPGEHPTVLDIDTDLFSNYSPPTMREAKRAARTIYKRLWAGNGDLQWFPGWANRDPKDDSLGILVFGSWGNYQKIETDCPYCAGKGERLSNKCSPCNGTGKSFRFERDESEFQDWIYGIAERMGYECTDADQTSCCDGCNRAIDSGSSTPDRYHVGNSAIYCEECANSDVIDSLKQEFANDPSFGYLNWRPNLEQVIDQDSGLCKVVVEDRFDAENFAKCELKHNRMKYNDSQKTGYFWFDDLLCETYQTSHNAYQIEYIPASNGWTHYADSLNKAQREKIARLAGKIDLEKHPLLDWILNRNAYTLPLFECDYEALTVALEALAPEYDPEVEITIKEEAAKYGLIITELEDN